MLKEKNTLRDFIFLASLIILVRNTLPAHTKRQTSHPMTNKEHRLQMDTFAKQLCDIVDRIKSKAKTNSHLDKKAITSLDNYKKEIYNATSKHQTKSSVFFLLGPLDALLPSIKDRKLENELYKLSGSIGSSINKATASIFRKSRFKDQGNTAKNIALMQKILLQIFG